MLLIEDELKKATVPQLKAICKEKGVAGYSKLSKAPLVAKLLEWQAKNASADDTTTPSAPSGQPAQSPTLTTLPSCADAASILAHPTVAIAPAVSPNDASTVQQSTALSKPAPVPSATPAAAAEPTISGNAQSMSLAAPSSPAAALAPAKKPRGPSKKSAKAHKTAATSESTKSALGPPAPSNKPLALAASPSTPRTPVVLDAILSSAATAYTQPAIDPTEPATISQVSSSGLSAETPPSTTTQSLGNTISPAVHKISASSTLPTKRTKAHPPTVPPPAKKQKSTLLPASSSRLHATQFSAQSKSSSLPQKLQQQNAALASFRPPSTVPSKRPTLENRSMAQPAKRAALESISVDSNPIKSVAKLSSKRFVPLRPVAKPVTKPANPSVRVAPSIPNSVSPPKSRKPSSKAPINERPLSDMAAITLPTPTTHPLISLPPSIRNRKRVGPWSIILSAVERDDLPRLYLTAGVRLERYFGGKRLVSDMKNTTMNKANLWPYLLVHEKETKARIAVYEQSWLPRVFAAHCPVVWRLWACPDHPKQATIALRFLMTRLFFDVSVQERETRREDFVITDAQEVLPGEIWEVTTREAGSTRICHVLEATCEVIGRVDPSLPKPAAALGDAAASCDADSYLPVRADWSAYVAMRETSGADSLLQHVSWEHRGEYERGISRLWLKRAVAEGEEGRIKLQIARRYVYACVCSNSVSGRYMRLTEMAQEFHGTEARGIASGDHFTQKQTVKLNMFLPGHHHVESVHLATSKGTALHAAVAVVQTPGREYYILRDNGMQIGCEEDGVAEVFREMLGCDRHGVAL
ncbi:hypothetical protein GGG16DRAFT_111748 [Schizophyllum commune]